MIRNIIGSFSWILQKDIIAKTTNVIQHINALKKMTEILKTTLLCAINTRGQWRKDNKRHLISSIRFPDGNKLYVNYVKIIRQRWPIDFVYPLRVNFFQKEQKHMSFFHTEMTKVVEILPQVRQGPTYFTSVSIMAADVLARQGARALVIASHGLMSLCRQLEYCTNHHLLCTS